MDHTTPHLVILIGPPGAGKDTQADLLAEDFGFFHIQSSKIIEKKFEEADPNDPLMQEEKQKFKDGKLTEPKLIFSWIMEDVRHERSQSRSIVFSGSPRTLFEAENETPLFEELYGKENISMFHIDIREEESIKRNSKRRICKAHRHPIPNFPEYETITACPKDGSEIVTRILDNPETIKVRYGVYLNETKPVLDFFKQHGYTPVDINGEQSIRNVHLEIMKCLDASAHKELLEKFGE